MFLTNIILLGSGIWAIWIGIKSCEQVHGIALILTGLIMAIWGLTLAPLGIQIFVEILLIVLASFLSNSSRINGAIELFQSREAE
ncbi:hypothetical protein [Lyngbya aestuarii]|uniref:hypothetical protein n=1 Tax=Lyngbya aestuarii TaxID=118322 RepID=UPI00403D8D75